MTPLEKIYSSRSYFDGGMGTLLQARGLKPGELPETWNLCRPEDITAIHADYLNAGADFITTNTFGANSLKFANVEEIISAGIACAKKAVQMAGHGFVAFDVGPLGKMLSPLGDLPFKKAVEIFSQSVRLAEKYGADVIHIETMNDAYETKAAVLAAKENCDLPIFATTVYDARAKLMTGADPCAMAALLEGLGVSALGMNCSLGPEQMLKVVPLLAAECSLPLIVNPNAGLPRSEGGKTVYDVNAEQFSDFMVKIAEAGATILGGCCGTTPEYIAKTVQKTKEMPFALPEKKMHTVVSSYTHGVKIGRGKPILIGERINPTGKSKFKQALRDKNMEYILNEGVAQQEAGADILDVNVGLPEIDEKAMMLDVVKELQAVSDLPLQLDTVDGNAMEASMREYNGKPLVNSVNGKKESMDAIFPLVKKYGGVLVALTLDESGIPDTAEGRYAIAEKIVLKAEEYGISRRDIVVDPLAMAISSDRNSALVTLESIRLIKERLGVCTGLGISNISFGLPNRDLVTSTFFALSLQTGLDCAIMNPFSTEMQKVYHCHNALKGLDANCEQYIGFAASYAEKAAPAAVSTAKAPVFEHTEDPLMHAIVKGLKEKSFALADEMAAKTDPLDVVNTQIIPALDMVGKGFEEKTVFLPQLLMSAEAAKCAFDAVKGHMPSDDKPAKGKIILATVKGDIHDIGKNIVKVLLSNYGYDVIDLGKDVDPQAICDCALEHDIKLVGLSALMTTTVPAMEETIALLRKSGSKAKVVVGGAVLTPQYAEMIKADRYAKDAMETVRYAEEIFA